MTDKDTCAGATTASGSLSKSIGPAVKGKPSLVSAGSVKSMVIVSPELCNVSCFSASPGPAGGKAQSPVSAGLAARRMQGAEVVPEDDSSAGSKEQLVSEGVLHS